MVFGYKSFKADSYSRRLKSATKMIYVSLMKNNQLK